MANYDELLEMIVIESAKEDKQNFKQMKKEINILVDTLKKSLKEDDVETCRKTITAIENKLSELRKFTEKLNVEDYKGHGWFSWVNFIRVVVMGLVQELLNTKHRFYYIDKKSNVEKMNEFKNEIFKFINKLNKVLDKLKKKCDQKEIKLSEINLKDLDEPSSIKESVDDIKLEIYESCYAGEITAEERDELLSLMD